MVLNKPVVCMYRGGNGEHRIYLRKPDNNLLFFFSSRRRHTSWNCDWSSDVSSSDLIGASVRKTSRVLVAYEDALSWGYGADIAAQIAGECFSWLDAPVKRVASTDTFVGYAPALEDFILPQVEDLARAMRELHAF